MEKEKDLFSKCFSNIPKFRESTLGITLGNRKRGNLDISALNIEEDSSTDLRIVSIHEPVKK